MSEIAIKIEHVSKEYRLGAIGGGTLRGDLQSWWARARGKEDPNLKLDQTSGRKGDRFLALDDVSFEVKKGEAVGIIGHNGAGKSTLLKLLSRVTAPTKGSISYNGRIASMLEVGTGFHPELTGRENVYMNGAILGMSKAEIDKKFDKIVAFAEMEKFIDTPVKRYSSGMYVKLAFAVAAHLDSEIMIMDEVLAVGDMKFQQKCLGKMGDAANNEGRTVLYVSHNMNTIRQLCTRCVVLDHGKVIFDGDVETAISIYMQKSIKLNLLNICDQERPYIDIDKHIRLNSVRFVNVEDTPIYTSRVPIKVEIAYTAMKDMNHLAFRLVLQTPDGIRAGMGTTPPSIKAEKGDNSIILQIESEWIAPGKYICAIAAYSVNEFGTDQVHDRVMDAFAFHIVHDEGEHNDLVWNHSAWGYMMIPEIKIMT